ncbi:glycosyl hydrolase 115 family protein [Streptomyces sp. DSM 44915]|uniref:Glycosyl hydrolase 115 family protein n=1 Tax=Streptomyces chisholmiae TaxID=3075540 RepID=A0ABU2JQE1_9ACTN|nr:glycosyl hydrolase 115 family protein [Streptomyces sp. DSM 44915]MDT0266423.1 glycosyl hydrolase 115 family protein [Streptomyces sp. DSM 44915]
MTSRRAFLSILPLTVAATAVPTVPAVAASAGGAGRPGARETFVTDTWRPGSLPLVAAGRATPILVSDADHPGVVRVAGDLSADLERVTGLAPEVRTEPGGRLEAAVIIGTIGRSPLVDRLVEAGKLDLDGIAGRWETSRQQVVHDPLPGVRRALVIAGSDQRGTIYGVYEVSRQAGVSPWYWWNDVPTPHRDALYALPGRHTQGTPAVRYRGFFINDENPALGTWAPAFFGPGHAPGFPNGFNSAFYAKVFEVMLRLRANYLWPAVWGRAFAEDDPANHATAAAYGVVMGTSHEAPMMRGIEEWNRHAVPAQRNADGEIVTPGSDPYGGTGEWSFRFNGEAVKRYWADGVRRMVDEGFEGVVTLGMRGNGDVSLPDGDGIELMENIIASQREILDELTDDDLASIPQVQTLYKEVQHYWDEGLRPPDDVTVILCDDNWGNLRKVPDPALPARSGGYGLYYHFDYVGVGRNYKWVDTVNLASTWEQLHLAYRYGIDRLWVVNVGDLKAEELPLQFFLDYAWDPERWDIDALGEWERRYAEQNFGPEQAEAIAAALHTYGVLQARRKPELLNRRITVDPARDLATDPSAVVYDDEASPFSLTDYRELERVTAEWEALDVEVQRIGETLAPDQQDAYYQLVQYQVEATANLYALRAAEFTNLLYARQGRLATNALAEATDARFADDQAMSEYYNHELASGKWAGFQTQPKIGYGDVARYGPDAGWQQPQTPDHVALPDEVFPPVRRLQPGTAAELGVAIDGSELSWPEADEPAVLPAFSPYQSQPRQYVEVFNRGTEPFPYTVTAAEPWLTVSEPAGTVHDQVRVELAVDFELAPAGRHTVPVTVTGAGRMVEVLAEVDNPAVPRGGLAGFVEANGYVSIEAAHYLRAVETAGVTWRTLPDLGRTGAGVTPFPVTAPRRAPGGRSPRLEYELTLFTTGRVRLWVHLSPRNNVLPTDGLSYAVSLDDEAPQTVNVTAVTGSDDQNMNPQWARNTSDNATVVSTVHTVTEPGRHLLAFWMVDPTVVLQKLVLDTGGLRPSYLGPPESFHVAR